MSGVAVEHVYRYVEPSRLLDRDGRPDLALATSGGATAHPYFVSGWVTRAAPHARAMLVVARTARSRYHVPPAMLERRLILADPVVTVDGEAVRFEAFSSCCGVYARHDLDNAGLDAEAVAFGTTNVDFNSPMRDALARVVVDGELHLTVGSDHVAALTATGAALERRVALPARWVKGFGEVHAVQAAMDPRLDLPATAVRQLLREVPRSGPPNTTLYIRASGGGLRFSRMGGADAVPLAGPQRLLLLEPLAGDARRLRVFANEAGASGWVLDLPGGRVTLVLSPEIWRGFSGEGAVLRELARNGEAAAAAKGLSGFDLATGTFFARRLPFDLDAVESLQPRLRAARELVEHDAVRVVEANAERAEAFVASGKVEYHVRLDGERARCTCPWFVKHRGERGPCKHVLAAELALERRAVH